MNNQYPILYSFRRCPYAMRARLGLSYAGISCELREIALRNKPQSMIALSQKATVPVLLLPDGAILDESYDIIKWAIAQNDPAGWAAFIPQANPLIAENDGSFKIALDRYKYPSRYPSSDLEASPTLYRDQGELFLKKLDHILQNSAFLLGPDQTLADIALFPFIRQFAHVDKDWFFNTPYKNLHQWLQQNLESPQFRIVMKKFPLWRQGSKATYFPQH